jgi:anti-anti-sigma factor
MTVSFREVDAFKIATITGPINEEESYEFRKKAVRLIDEGCKNLVINLKGVSHLSSYTIGLFVSLWKRVAESGGAFGVIVDNRHLREKLYLVHLNTIVRFFESENELLEEIANGKKREFEWAIRDRLPFKIVDLHEPFNVFCGFHQFDGLVSDLYSKGNRRIALNLDGVVHIYSEAIGVIVKWTQLLQNNGGKLVLIGLSPEIHSRLEVLGLQKPLNIVSSEEDLKE